MSILSLESITKGYTPHSNAVENVALKVAPGELLALTGESGCGKTTILRLIAGLERPDQGIIKIEDQLVSDHRQVVPPQNRAVGLVFQDYALFPHMSVRRNIAYGLKKWTKSESEHRIKQLLKLVNLEGLENRYPHQLSGGQQQRVAIARALAPRPKILLLDEPFSNLDTVLKHQVRLELSEILRKSGTTVILVTHDIDDALSMAHRIAVMRKGRLLQVDTPSKLYYQPVDQYAAYFFGKVNLVPTTGQESDEISRLPGFNREPQSEDGFWCLRPEHLHLVSSDQPGIEVEIISIDFLGGFNQFRVKFGQLELWSHHTPKELFKVGDKIRIGIDFSQVHFIKG
jgi:iron(III) transport system ATP-binding protein